MVTGIDSFKEWFKGSEEQYAIIGGTACDILMTEEGLDFRATKDIDLVLIIEAVDANFGKKFWEYVKQAGYEHCNKSSGVPQFYRFSHPITNQYPAMIELFTRKLDAIQLPEDAELHRRRPPFHEYRKNTAGHCFCLDTEGVFEPETGS